MVIVNCAYCGEEKDIFASRFARYSLHFCDNHCKHKYNEKIPFVSPDKPCSGYIDGSGRARVFYPGHSRADKYGYTLRSVVHYEYYNNIIVTKDYNIHHKDRNRLNDTEDNLQCLTQSEHSKLHHPKGKKFGDE